MLQSKTDTVISILMLLGVAAALTNMAIFSFLKFFLKREVLSSHPITFAQAFEKMRESSFWQALEQVGFQPVRERFNLAQRRSADIRLLTVYGAESH
jgi:hypothetical protein